MDYRTLDSITVLEGLQAVRRRPALYIGAEETDRSPPARMLEYVVSEIAQELPREVRVLLWREGAVTVAYDGDPLPIEPSGTPAEGVSHPALYRSFMYLLAGPKAFGAVLNALSERLVVSTMHDDHRYRVVFSRGMLLTLLQRVHCDEPLGVTWLTFRPDAMVINGEALTIGEVHRITERVVRNAEGERIRVEDRTTEDADWSFPPLATNAPEK
jgi:DNA gyrase/topoisomerase IV subunit B